MSNERRRRPFARREDAGAPADREIDALKNELRALPELEAPGELWEPVHERLGDHESAAEAPSPLRRGRQTPMALAAGIAVIAAAAVLVSVHLSTGDTETVGKPVIAGDNGTPQPVPESPDHAAIIEALLAQSQVAEERRRAVLAFYSPSGPEQVLREQIGGIDAALNEQMFAGKIEPKFRETMLRDRVELIANLTDIERYRQHEIVRQVSF
ncbi:MAG: hypothetical protein J4F38_08010 [Pseudomonadales bacterium]|nr:hypothetical protein [Pseudomonadales bacterium]